MLVTSFALPLLVALGALGAPTPGTESQPEERGLEKHVKSSIRMAAEWDRCLVVGYRWSGIAM
jgi:hypothetical protein